MNGFREKCKNLNLWAYRAKKANFGQFWAKMGETIFSKERLEHIFHLSEF